MVTATILTGFDPADTFLCKIEHSCVKLPLLVLSPLFVLGENYLPSYPNSQLLFQQSLQSGVKNILQVA
jgi:hypothetical protein